MEEVTQPLFRQIAALIEDTIVDGSLTPGSRSPSTNELAAFHQINPATARKGLNLLAASGVLQKRAGIGMFVTDQARSIILGRRREEFAAIYIAPLVDEAVKLGLSRSALRSLVEKVAESRGLYS